MRHEIIEQVQSTLQQAGTPVDPVEPIEVLYVEPRHLSTHLYIGIEKCSFFTKHNGIGYTLLFSIDTMTSEVKILGVNIETSSDNKSKDVDLELLKYDEGYKEYLKASVDNSAIDVIRALKGAIQSSHPTDPSFFCIPLSLPPIMR